jgi:centrosomal protein CEP135
VQVSSLTNRIAHLEDDLKQLEDEKHALLQDISAIRDLCAKLEASKDNLQRQLTNKALDHDKLENLLEDMQSETDVLRSQVNTERSSVRSLEGLLASNRERDFQNQMSSQEMAAEVQLLKDRLALNDSKM